MKMLARRLALALGAVAVLVGLYLSVFFFPYPLFRHHTRAAGFSVYSDREIPAEFGLVLDDARRRVEAMPLYRGGGLPRIFVCRSRRLFELLVKLAGKRHAGQGLLISAAGNAFLSEQGIRAVARRNTVHPAHSRLEGSWPAAIAHEVAHQLVVDELGFWKTRKIPVWKAEGYADYSANLASASSEPDSAPVGSKTPPSPVPHALRCTRRCEMRADLVTRVAILLDDEAWRGSLGFVDRRHFRWQLEVEYLCTVGGLDLSGLLADEVTEAVAWNEMMEWWGRQAGR